MIAQVGISLALLIGAGAFLRTVDNLRQTDLGFDAENLVLFGINPQLNRYARRGRPRSTTACSSG